MTLHYIGVLCERPCNLSYKLWWYNNIDLTRNLTKNRHFVRFYPVIYEKRELNTNRHLARSVTFEAVILEVLRKYSHISKRRLNMWRYSPATKIYFPILHFLSGDFTNSSKGYLKIYKKYSLLRFRITSKDLKLGIIKIRRNIIWL